MYGQIQTLVGQVLHPEPNSEHREIAAQIQTLMDKLKTTKATDRTVVAPTLPTQDQELSRMSNQELRDYTINLSNRMREFAAVYRAKQVNNEMSWQQIGQDKSKREEIWRNQTQQLLQNGVEHEKEFRQQFWGDVHVTYNEIMMRLLKAQIRPPDMPSSFGTGARVLIQEGAIVGADPIENAASYLEILARTLS
jgi:hypothetical protein